MFDVGSFYKGAAVFGVRKTADRVQIQTHAEGEWLDVTAEAAAPIVSGDGVESAPVAAAEGVVANATVETATAP